MKIEKESSLLAGARKLLHLQSTAAGQEIVRCNIKECEQRLQYLNMQRNVLEMASNDAPPVPPRTIPAVASFRHLLVSEHLSTARIHYRIVRIGARLEIEKRVQSGIENMMQAFKVGNNDKYLDELAMKLMRCKEKQMLLEIAYKRFEGLLVGDICLARLSTGNRRMSGMLEIKLITASDPTNNSYRNPDLEAHVYIDNTLRYSTKKSSTGWNESFTISLTSATDIEIVVASADRTTSFLWFSPSDFWKSQDSLSNTGAPLLRMEMEPYGIMTMYCSLSEQKSKPQVSTIMPKVVGSSTISRQKPVKRVYPRNGHLFSSKDYQCHVKCALCLQAVENGHAFSCENCSYNIHPTCYESVITKCITRSQIESVSNINVGIRSKYRPIAEIQHTSSLGCDQALTNVTFMWSLRSDCSSSSQIIQVS